MLTTRKADLHIHTTVSRQERTDFEHSTRHVLGAWGSVVVKALRYKSVGPGIDSKR